jgi:hypothetical protein
MVSTVKSGREHRKFTVGLLLVVSSVILLSLGLGKQWHMALPFQTVGPSESVGKPAEH